MLIRDIDPNLISEASAAGAILRPSATTGGSRVAQVTGLGGGAAAVATVANDYSWLDQEIIEGIPYTPFDVAMDLGFIAAGVVVGAIGGPAGEAAAIGANLSRLQRIVKIVRAGWSKISFINPIEKLTAKGLSTKEFLRKIILAAGESMTWSLVVNTIVTLLAKQGIKMPNIPDAVGKGVDAVKNSIPDAIKNVFNEDGEQQPTQDQIRDPAFCAAHGIETTIDPALEKDPMFIDAYVAARHYHKSIVKYNGKTYPVHLEADMDGPDAPSGFTVSESADLARIKLLTHKLLNG